MINFKTEKVSKRITRIYGVCTELMYLVEGDEKAALLDTGSGFGSLKSVIDNLTDKPIIVLLTHGHTDHAMGAGEFDTVYMNHKDDYIYIPHGDEKFRWEGIMMSDEAATVEKKDYIPTVSVEKFLDLSEGDSFDIGGCTIEMYNCAGHTKGSLAMLIREENTILLGDACNGNTFLFEDYSTTVEQYKESLERLKLETEGKYKMVLSSHGDGNLPVDIIDEVIGVCKDIMKGNVDDIPMVFRGKHGMIAKKTVKPDGTKENGKIGNIVYSKEKIR